MGTPYLSELRIFSFGFAPKGWALANGQTLSIQQNAALFALLGTTYGGNGTTTFQLPNLQGRTPIHFGGGYPQGQSAGEASHTLITNEMPAHTHQANGSSTAADQGVPGPTMLWAQRDNAYNTAHNASMNPTAIANAGGSQPHNNLPPYLVLNIAIALQGIFPSRN